MCEGGGRKRRGGHGYLSFADTAEEGGVDGGADAVASGDGGVGDGGVGDGGVGEGADGIGGACTLCDPGDA